MTPSIGIGIPVFNGEDFLEDCLRSIEGQDHEPLDVLISDNASTDASGEICREFVQRDPRFRYVRQPVNLGAAGNYNFVMNESRGELYKMAAHDDVLGPGFLRRCTDELASNPHAVLAFPGTTYIDADGRPTGVYDHPIKWTHATTPAGRLEDLLLVHEHSTYLHLCYPVMGVMRRAAATTTRGIQSFQAADAAMLVELALMGDFAMVAEPLYQKRLHANTSMRANRTSEDFALWYDPRNAGRSPLPLTRLARSHLSAVWRQDLTPADRLACTSVISRWLVRDRHARIIGSELRAALRSRVSGRRTRPAPSGTR